MQDPITGKDTCLCGARLPDESARAALLGCHRERLRAFDHLVEAAAQCGIFANKDRDFAVLPEDEVSLLELAGESWRELGNAIRHLREVLPFVELDCFGFKADGEDIFETNTQCLVRIGAGVEALAFEGQDTSIYKFFYFREGGEVGSAFRYARTEEGEIHAMAVPASYRLLLAKLLIIHQIGMPTEVVGITRDGILVVKQTLGRALPHGTDTSGMLPMELIVIPSRFLRADRDHPRLLFLDDQPWLVADLHARNLVQCVDGNLRAIDLVAAPWPDEMSRADPHMHEWLERVRNDPTASVLPPANDDEL